MSKAPLILCLSLACTAMADSLQPWASNTDPSDVPRQHMQIVSTSPYQYTIVQRGTMDGENCRSPIGYAPWTQTFESNRAVRMENIGDTDIVNPWLSNGRNDLRTIQEILAAALDPGMSDREKAIALYTFQRRHRFHATTSDNELWDPVKMLNIYGFTLCGDDAICLAGLWHSAGLKASPTRPRGHSVSQVFYDGKWHVLDGDENCVYLLRDNHTIASEQDIVRDHDLIKRTHTYGILARDDRLMDEFSAALWVNEAPPSGRRDCLRGHTMSMVLRPGEAITWRWGHLVPCKYHGRANISSWSQKAVDKVCNGLWEYRPDFTTELWKQGAERISGIVSDAGYLHAAGGGAGFVIWKMQSPYVFVGGRLQVEGQGARFSLSFDGKTWQPATADLDPFFPPAGPARYRYFLRCELAGDAFLRSLAIINDLQMAPLALPGMRIGKNTFTYTDESPTRQVLITHQWVERSADRPPPPPPAPVFPPRGGRVEGTQFTFRWVAPKDPDGDRITDYHFELSDRPDMKWPLSPNFEKLISKTADKGKPQYTIPYTGLLTPGTTYYWRVRAMDEHGVWGPWSGTWRFIPQGPAPPVNVRFEQQPGSGAWLLKWDPNPVGRRPACYRVYGSDEKGFTASDQPYAVNGGLDNYDAGGPRQWKILTFPPNFVAETTVTWMQVIGPRLTLPNANKAFYRVVAVDENGVPSGPSDYAAAPRPFIYTEPPPAAVVGQRYNYQVASIRSLGDLRLHGKYRVTTRRILFGDIEQPLFSLQQAPGWLAIDRHTGLVSGIPPAEGSATVVVAATIDGVGTATQRFVINITR